MDNYLFVFCLTGAQEDDLCLVPAVPDGGTFPHGTGETGVGRGLGHMIAVETDLGRGTGKIVTLIARRDRSHPSRKTSEFKVHNLLQLKIKAYLLHY